MAPLVTFIVPLFNKVDFVAECLSSIRDCTYPNKEVIVVEDCSTDGSDVIAEHFCKTNEWHFIRHAANRGLSRARNTGLSHAMGDFIQFWDADDVYARDGLTTLVADIEEDRSDFGTALATRNGTIARAYLQANKHVRKTTFRETPECISAFSTCFKLYRKSFLLDHNLRFVPGLYMQDIEFNLRAATAAERITMTPYIIGDYRLVGSSGSKAFNANRIRSACEIEWRSKEAFLNSGFEDMEEWRQRKILLEVLLIFVKRVFAHVDGKLSLQNGWRIEWVRDKEPFIDMLRKAVGNCPLGIRAIIADKPHLALAALSLAEGMLTWVSGFMVHKLPEHDPCIYMPTNSYFSKEDVAECVRRISSPSRYKNS